MITVSVDCGVRGCGVAEFDEKTLVRAKYVKNPIGHGQDAMSALAMARAVQEWFQRGNVAFHRVSPSQLAIETMKVYEAAGQKGDQNDLLGVQLVAGAITGIMGCPVKSYIPMEWKGTVDGDAFTQRIMDRLTAVEVERVTWVSATVDHNTIDGIGIGLKYLGRMDPIRKFPRE